MTLDKSAFGAALGLCDVSRLEWAEILLVANREVIANETLVSIVETLHASIAQSGYTDMAFTDLDEMFQEYFSHRPEQWRVVVERLRSETWSFPELCIILAVLHCGRKTLPETQGVVFDLALALTTTIDSCRVLHSLAATNAQMRSVLERMFQLGVYTADLELLIWYASQLPSERSACDVLVRRLDEVPLDSAEHRKIWLRVYLTCALFSDLEVDLHDRLSRLLVFPLTAAGDVELLAKICRDVAGENLLFDTATTSVIAIAFAIEGDPNRHPDVGYQSLAAAAAVMRDLLHPNAIMNHPLMPQSRVLLARSRLWRAMEARIGNRDDAVHLLKQVSRKDDERLFLRLCVLVRKFSTTPAPDEPQG